MPSDTHTRKPGELKAEDTFEDRFRTRLGITYGTVLNTDIESVPDLTSRLVSEYRKLAGFRRT